MILALALATFACVLAAAVIDLRNTPRPALSRAGRPETAPAHTPPTAVANPAPIR
jgi:hypothetical protein